MIYHVTKQSGFSLVEVLVAISILLLVIVGPMTMITRSNNATSFASEQSTAWFLAQEGLELAQKQRDDLLLEHFNNSGSRPNPWSDFTSPSGVLGDCFGGRVCGLTIQSNSNPAVDVVDCSTMTNCKLYLYLDSLNSVRPNYVHSSGATTPYTRVITMVETNPGQVKVTSTVTWRTGSLIAGQEVEAVTYLFNVYGKQ